MKQFFFILCLLASPNLKAQKDTIYSLTILLKDSTISFQEMRNSLSYDQLLFLLETVYNDAIKEKEEAEKKTKRLNAKKSEI